jgi:hypothetical protein
VKFNDAARRFSTSEVSLSQSITTRSFRFNTHTHYSTRRSDGEKRYSRTRASEDMLKQEEMVWSGGCGEGSDGEKLPSPPEEGDGSSRNPPCRSPASMQSLEGNGNDAATCASRSAYAGTYCTSAYGTAAGRSVALGTVATTGEDLENVIHQHVGGITDDGLHQFYEAMSLVDSDKKEGWTKAQSQCSPAVLQHECCPCYFVLACQFNPWDAAVRMCAYWEERIELFEDRAFEAMALGSEAVPPTGLTREDVKMLETGATLPLPKDRKGRSVIFLDEGKMEPHMLEHVASRLRVLWYVHHANFTSGGENVHRLVALSACYKPPNTGKYGAQAYQYSSGSVRFVWALPVVVESIHLLTLQTKSGTGTFIHIILAATAAMLGNFLSSLTKVHHGTAKRGTYANPVEEEAHAKSTLLQKLLDAGFAKKGLPEWAGGSFSDQDFRSWATRRRRFEQRVFWTPEQRTQHRREMNRVHSRKKRRRRHEELSDLQDQVALLEEANAQARRVQAHLEQLVVAALDTVTSFQMQPTPRRIAPRLSNDWFSDPSCLPESFIEPHQLSILASLEPDPIALSTIPSLSIPTSVGARQDLFHAPLRPLSLSGGEQREAEHRSADFDAHALTESKLLYGSPYRPVLVQQESYASSSSALQHSHSSAGESASSYPTVFGSGLARSEPDGMISLQANAAASLMQREHNSSTHPTTAHGVTAVHIWQQPLEPSGAEASDSCPTAAFLLRAMFRQQPQFFANMGADPPEQLRDTPTNDDYQTPSSRRRWYHPRPASLSLRSPGPPAGAQREHGVAATHPMINHSDATLHNRRRSRDDDYDGGRVDASTLFDLDW